MINRYSDTVPYEKRKYWYFTTHGIGPGTIPKDLKVLEVKEGRNDKGTLGDFICLDGILNTSELKEFDLRELVPPEEDNVDICVFLRKYLQENGLYVNRNLWEENGEIHVVLLDLDESMHEHEKLDMLMSELDYEERLHINSEDLAIEHVFTKR